MLQPTEPMGIILRRLRKAAGLSVQQTSNLLRTRFGRRANVTTLYSYENTAHPRMPNAGLFLELCQIYGCSSILETFAHVQFNHDTLTETEWELVRKFRSIDEKDQELLLSMLKLFEKRTDTDMDAATNADSLALRLVADAVPATVQEYGNSGENASPAEKKASQKNKTSRKRGRKSKKGG